MSPELKEASHRGDSCAVPTAHVPRLPTSSRVRTSSLSGGAGDVCGGDHGGAAPPPRRRLAPRGAPPPPVNARTRHAQGGEGGACRRRESTGDPGTRGEGDPSTRGEGGACRRRQVRCRRQSACSFMNLRCRLPPGAPHAPQPPRSPWCGHGCRPSSLVSRLSLMWRPSLIFSLMSTLSMPLLAGRLREVRLPLIHALPCGSAHCPQGPARCACPSLRRAELPSAGRLA